MNCGKRENRGLAYGQQMNLLAVSIANAIAEGRSAQELDFLSSVLQLVGEALAVIASTTCENDEKNELCDLSP